MTAIKPSIFVVLVWLFTGSLVTAQESRSERFARIEAEKIAFITKELNLTPTEAQEFFPVYNQYYKEISKLRQERRGRMKKENQNQNLQHQRFPTNGFNPSSRDVLAFDAKELEVKKIYRKRFATVVGQARASQFFEVEEEFRSYLLRELQHRRRDKKH